MTERNDANLSAAAPGFFRRVFGKTPVKLLWLPLIATLGSLVLPLFTYSWNFRWLSGGLELCYFAGLLWFLVLAILRFFSKRIAAGFIALVCLVISIAALVPVAFVGMFQSEDGFGEGLKLPQGVELAEPLGHYGSSEAIGGPADTFQAAIRATLSVSGGENVPISIALPSLEKLRKDHPALLDRYLAAHPGWRVYEQRGSKFATRRWMMGDHWQMTLNGDYSSFFDKNGPRFQTRTTIGFSQKPWGKTGQKVAPGIPIAPELTRANEMWQSFVTLPAADLLIEQFEQNNVRERRVTRAAMAELEREFAALAVNPTWDAVRTLLPPDSVLRGKPWLELRRSTQGGIYNASIRCNPGRSGRVYLKAFEITRKVELSSEWLETETNEWIGWSSDPEEQFLSESNFTIYEGDWEQYYGARFEVWFKPDDGGPERKLLERNFKIEGWMR